MFKDLTIEEKIKYLDGIKELEKMLPDYDIYLQFGTLLGAVRGSELPDYDNDIDVCYLSHYHMAEEVEQEIKNIYKVFADKGMLLKYFTRDMDKSFWETGDINNINRPFGQAHIMVKDICIDFFTSWIDEKGNYYTCQWGNFGDSSKFFPVISKSVYGIDLKIPNNSEMILERLYGDWRTPRDEKSKLPRRSFLEVWLTKYSVVIPCYTPTKSDFRRCLDYWKNQTIKPYEVIVIDDASPTNVPKMALEYGFKYIRHEVNKHNGGARNTGMRAAKGDYLIFCNADDYFELDTIEELNKVNDGQNLIIVGFSVFGKMNVKNRFVPDWSNTPNISQFNWNGEAMHIVKRQFILDNNLFELENVPIADRDWTLRLEALKPTYTFAPNKALYNYQWGHEGAIMTKILNKEIVNNLDNPDYYNEQDEKKNIDVIIYEHLIPKVGGNATSLLRWCQHMHKYYNITVLYKDCDLFRLSQLKQYANCVRYTGQEMACDQLIWNSSWGAYPTTIKSKGKPKQMLHANYKEVYKLNSFLYKRTADDADHISVSNHVKEAFKDMYGIDSIVIPNMLEPKPKVDKVMHYIACTRLTPQKGLKRIEKWVNEHKKRGKKFYLFIYGDGNNPKDIEQLKKIPEVFLMPVSFDLPSYMADADYLIHFSDTEGDPYCTKEALQVNTPCITTNYPATYEQIEDGKNGYILDFDLFDNGTEKDWDKVINKIYNKIPKFKFKNKDGEIEQIWINEVLGKPVGELKHIKKQKQNTMRYEAIVLKGSFYKEEEKQCEKGDILIIDTLERLEYLEGLGYVKRTGILQR